jgi:anti-sigma factor RsiW
VSDDVSDDMDDDVFSAYLDGELGPDGRTGFEARLEADPRARRELDAISEVRTLVRGLAPPVAPAGFIDDLLAASDPDADASGPTAPVTDLAAARATRRRPARFAAIVASVAAAVALLLAAALPDRGASNPALATNVRVHQAGTAAGGDPVSGLAPLATPLRFGR